MSRTSSTRLTPATLLFTSLMLFSMFFGAGNLIFPPMLGATTGTNFWPAICGFLGTAVLLPVLAIVAIVVTGSHLRDLASRAGRVVGLVFPILVYLSIGACYALPRTGAVSFSTAITPVTGWSGLGASAAFNAVFFGIALALSLNPAGLVDKLGKWLTPALIVLLLLLVVGSLLKNDPQPTAPSPDWQHAPAAHGLLEGYLTMDAVAGLAFGIIVISTLGAKTTKRSSVLSGTIISGAIAGTLLGVIYVGLGLVGRAMPDPSRFDDGASLLSAAAHDSMGFGGQLIFGLVVLLACMTTAVGLIAATSEFFETLLPGVRYRTWAIIFAISSFGIGTLGLKRVLSIAAPVIGFIYPIAVCFIVLAMLAAALRTRVTLSWTFTCAVWVTIVCSLIDTAVSLGANSLAPATSWLPFASVGLGWVIPAVVFAALGLCVDVVRAATAATPTA